MAIKFFKISHFMGGLIPFAMERAHTDFMHEHDRHQANGTAEVTKLFSIMPHHVTQPISHQVQ